jgi:hypothetical protein
LLLGWRFNISVLINRVILATLDRICEDLGCLLNTLEEAIILRIASSGLLIGMVTKNLLAVSTLDLLFGGSESML